MPTTATTSGLGSHQFVTIGATFRLHKYSAGLASNRRLYIIQPSTAPSSLPPQEISVCTQINADWAHFSNRHEPDTPYSLTPNSLCVQCLFSVYQPALYCTIHCHNLHHPTSHSQTCALFHKKAVFYRIVLAYYYRYNGSCKNYVCSI